MLIPRIMIETRGAQYGAFGGRLYGPNQWYGNHRRPRTAATELDILNVELVKVDMGLALLIETNDTGARALYRA